MTPATQARLIADAALMLAKRLDATGGTYDRRAQRNLFNLCNAVIGLIDDGNAWEQREVLMHELGCDEHGNPVDENGDSPARDAVSFGMAHPDSPSFGGRWL